MIKYSKLSSYTQKKILKCFCEDIEATKTANILWLHRNTIDRFYTLFREKIYRYLQQEKHSKLWWWIYELDESYFWPSRIKGKRWRWAWWKTIVFWLLKRDWKVYTEIVPNAKAISLVPIIRGKIDEWSIVNTDWWRSYDWLVDVWYEKHYRVHHWENEFARWKQHINWIESFWSFTKRRLRKHNWVAHSKFEIYLKECEFRFNARQNNIFDIMIKVLQDF